VSDRLLTSREVAEMLALSQETVLRRARRRDLPAFRLPGDAIRSRGTAIDSWLDDRCTETADAPGRSFARVRCAKGATISIKFADARKGTYVLDVSDGEAEELGQQGRKQARRGRRPKAAQA
jgi:excisionase family DNA binding protein